MLASDDPGIFANHLPADFAHLLETLVVDKHLSHKDAMVHLKQLNDNGKDFLFGQKNLPPKAKGLGMIQST